MLRTTGLPSWRACGTALALSGLLWAGCRTAGGAGPADPGAAPERRVDISTDRETYSPLMSSTVGIGLTARYSAAKTSPPFRWHWHTNYGYFVQWGSPDFQVKELGPDTSTESGKIYWSYDPVDMDQRNKPEVEIVVTVRDAKTLDSWAESRLRIKWENSDTARVAGPGRADER